MAVTPHCPNCGNLMRFEPTEARDLRQAVPVVCDACGIRDEVPRFVPVPTHAD